MHPCRHCNTEMAFTWPAGEDRWVVRECPVCGYVNVIEESWFALGLAERVERYATSEEMEELKSSSNDPRKSVGTIMLTARVLVRALRELVRAEVEVAGRALLPALNRREKMIQKRLSAPTDYDVDSEADVFSRVVDLLFLTLASEEALDVASIKSPNSKGVASFLTRFQHIASDLAVLAMFARSVRRGELIAALRDGVLGLRKGERHAMAAEWAFNRRKRSADQRLGDGTELFSKAALQAQALFLGFTALDILELSKDTFASLRSQGIVSVVRDSILFDIDRAPERARLVLTSATLTLRRAKEFERPFFFDLGKRTAQNRGDDEALVWATAANWSYYYPFLALPEPETGRRWALTNQGTVVTFLANLHAQKNGLLEKIVEAARESASKDADTLRDLIRVTNRELEESAVIVGHRAGWSSRHVDRVGGKRLACGDIDALFGRKLEGGEVVVVVAEVKDADYMPHKDNLFDEEHERQVQKALEQLQRKTEWLQAGWKQGLGASLLGIEFGAETAGWVLMLLVTRVAPPLYLITTAESATIEELESYLNKIRNGLPPWLVQRRKSALRLGEGA